MLLKLLQSMIWFSRRYYARIKRGLLVSLIINIVRSVIALSFTFILVVFVGWVLGKIEVLNSSVVVLGIWSSLEIVFFSYCQNLRLSFSERTSYCGRFSEMEKEYVTRQYLEGCKDPWAAVVRWFPRHRPQDIGFECMQEWISWAYFSKNPKTLDPNENMELDQIMKKIIQKCPRVAKPSSSKKPFRFMRLHFDRMIVQHKPLILVLIIYMIQFLGNVRLGRMGFEHHKISGTTLSYWTHSLKSTNDLQTKSPIFIVHGIGGIGLYHNLFKAILKTEPGRPIVILDMAHISLRLVRSVPTMEETIQAIDQIYSHHYLTDCSWIGHSYGSIVTSWVVKERPHFVNNLTLIDPVCFALWEPDLIYNFLYKPPSNPTYRILQFFIAQDLLVAYTLFRNFWWAQNILFPEEIVCPGRIYLSSHDSIIDSSRILTYLKSNMGRGKSFGAQVRSQIPRHQVVTMDGVSHSGFLNSKIYMSQIVHGL